MSKENIKILFFEIIGGQRYEIGEGQFTYTDVHHQYAINFKTPPYIDPDILVSVNAYIQLLRPSDNAVSKAREFEFYPSNIQIKKRRLPSYLETPDDSMGNARISRAIKVDFIFKLYFRWSFKHDLP